MAEFAVQTNAVKAAADAEEKLRRELEDIRKTVRGISGGLAARTAASAGLKRRLDGLAGRVESQRNSMGNMKNALERVAGLYEEAERNICGYPEGGAKLGDVKKEFMEEFKKNFGWSELLRGAGYIGVIYDFMEDFKKIDSPWDFLKELNESCWFATGAVKTYKNYKQIGNAVGKNKAMGWWLKNITGLKPLKRVSTAKTPIARFANNLTNKTSPYHAQYEKILSDFKGKNGVGKAAASWAGVALSGVLNFQSNLEEQRNSNGTMSDFRVAAETVTETVIDTALRYGANIVVGAAISAALPIAAPGVVVVAATGATIAAVNAGVKALTGKTTTEWASDLILDGAEKIVNESKKVVKNVAKSVGNWVGQLGRGLEFAW